MSARSASILVVDDEPDVAHLFRQRVRREAREGTYVMHFAAAGVELCIGSPRRSSPPLSRFSPTSTCRAWTAWSCWLRSRAAGSRSYSNGMPPNLLAHYCYLWEPTAVRQAIETAWISASVRRTFVEVLVPAG